MAWRLFGAKPLLSRNNDDPVHRCIHSSPELNVLIKPLSRVKNIEWDSKEAMTIMNTFVYSYVNRSMISTLVPQITMVPQNNLPYCQIVWSQTNKWCRPGGYFRII